MSTYEDLYEEGHSGPGILPILGVGAAIVALICILYLGTESDRQTTNQLAYQADIARQDTAQALAHEETSRLAAGQETQRQLANLRAEQTARITDYVMLILASAGGLIMVLLAGGLILLGLNWQADQQFRRTLYLYGGPPTDPLLERRTRGLLTANLGDSWSEEAEPLVRRVK